MLLQKELEVLKLQLNERVNRSHKILRSMQELVDRKKVENIRYKLNNNAFHDRPATNR